MTAERRAKLDFARDAQDALADARRRWLIAGTSLMRLRLSTPKAREPFAAAECEYVRAFRAARACLQLGNK